MKENTANSLGQLFGALIAGDDTTALVGADLSEVFTETKPEKLVIQECEGDGQGIGGITANWWVVDADGIQFKGKLPYPDSFDGDELFRTFPMIKFSLGNGMIRYQIQMGMGNNVCIQANAQDQGDRVTFDAFETVYRYRDGVRS